SFRRLFSSSKSSGLIGSLISLPCEWSTARRPLSSLRGSHSFGLARAPSAEFHRSSPSRLNSWATHSPCSYQPTYYGALTPRRVGVASEAAHWWQLRWTRFYQVPAELSYSHRSRWHLLSSSTRVCLDYWQHYVEPRF